MSSSLDLVAVARDGKSRVLRAAVDMVGDWLRLLPSTPVGDGFGRDASAVLGMWGVLVHRPNAGFVVDYTTSVERLDRWGRSDDPVIGQTVRYLAAVADVLNCWDRLERAGCRSPELTVTLPTTGVIALRAARNVGIGVKRPAPVHPAGCHAPDVPLTHEQPEPVEGVDA